MMINETVHFLQWEHLALTLYSLHWDMGTRVEAWPGLCLETLCLRLSISAQMSGFWGWVGFSGNRALL